MKKSGKHTGAAPGGSLTTGEKKSALRKGGKSINGKAAYRNPHTHTAPSVVIAWERKNKFLQQKTQRTIALGGAGGTSATKKKILVRAQSVALCVCVFFARRPLSFLEGGGTAMAQKGLHCFSAVLCRVTLSLPLFCGRKRPTTTSKGYKKKERKKKKKASVGAHGKNRMADDVSRGRNPTYAQTRTNTHRGVDRAARDPFCYRSLFLSRQKEGQQKKGEKREESAVKK